MLKMQLMTIFSYKHYAMIRKMIEIMQEIFTHYSIKNYFIIKTWEKLFL